MHVGLFFGSFNPVHIGHMAIANYMLNETDIDQVWMVLSPQNPLKQKSSLLDQYHRLALLNLAIDDFPNIKSSKIEFDLPQPSYTINTLAHLEELHPTHRFSLLLGQDNLQTFDKWKNYEAILARYHLYVYPRANASPGRFEQLPQVHLTKAPIMEVSSTFIRESIKHKKDIRFFLPQKVWDEIDLMNFYK